MQRGKMRPEEPTKVSMPSALHPVDQCCRRKGADCRFQHRARRAIARQKDLKGLGMGEVEAAPARQQKLARRRRHVITNDNLEAWHAQALLPPSARQDLRHRPELDRA